MTFIIRGTISNNDNSQILDTLTDLKDNYNQNQKLGFVQADSELKAIQFALDEPLYNDFVATLTLLINAYGSRFKWNFTFQEEPVP